MSNTLYFEASVCPYTGVSGWGAVLEIGDSLEAAPAGLCHFEGLSSTCASLAAAQAAFQAVARRNWTGLELTLATRSTAAMAVLRWVFPDAAFDGVVDVHPPKKLKPEMKDFQPIYDLHEDVVRSGVRIRLELVAPSRNTTIATGAARIQMESARATLQQQERSV